MSGEGRFEEDLEERGLVDLEGDGLYDRYILALILLVGCIIAFAFTGDGEWGRLATVVIEGVTLIVILRSSRVHQRILRAGVVLVSAAVVVGAVTILLSDDGGRKGPAIVGAALAVVGPPAIIHRLLAHHRIDLTTVAGALCVYLLAGIFFAYIYWIIGEFDRPFFAQTVQVNAVDYMYFSFTTLATLGYGDFTARGDIGRMLSVCEAVLGQLYLVSAVALLVANIGRTRQEAAPPNPNKPPRPSLPQHLRRTRRPE
jgi:hypothetical protein